MPPGGPPPPFIRDFVMYGQPQHITQSIWTFFCLGSVKCIVSLASWSDIVHLNLTHLEHQTVFRLFYYLQFVGQHHKWRQFHKLRGHRDQNDFAILTKCCVSQQLEIQKYKIQIQIHKYKMHQMQR